MVRVLYVTSLIFAILLANTDIDTKIATTQNKMVSFDQEYKQLNSKMAQTAQDILTQEKDMLDVQKKLEELEKGISVKEKEYNDNKKRLATLSKSRDELMKFQEITETDLIFAIARNITLSMLLSDKRTVNADSLINEEILKKLSDQTKGEITTLNSELSENAQKIETLKEETNALKVVIDEMDLKYKELAQEKKKSLTIIGKYKDDSQKYKKSLDTLLSQQDALKKTLDTLNILKQDNEKRLAEQKEEAAQRKKEELLSKKERQQSTKGKESVAVNEDLPDVKNVGSSYQEIKTKPYKGEKTIAPLDEYEIVKKYGTYTDPIYNIKIFNESISLKPKERGAKVKNVLNGKVIFAKETALLDNVVIVEHDDGLHTIYAKLEKIPSTIQKGTKVKKGTIIGRVNDDLIFEVTQENYHINPMQLIN